MATTEWVLLSIGVALAALLTWLWRRAEARATELTAARDALAGERTDLISRLARESQAKKKQAEELASFRKRAEKLKKRSAKAEKGASDKPMGTAVRLADFEAQVERAERELNRSRAEREQLRAQVTQLETRLEVRARVPEPVAVAIAPAPPVDRQVEELRDALAAQREDVAKMREELRAAKETEVRMRKRMANQEQLYASVRAELDVKKDRLRTQDEQIRRLEALKAVVGSD